jgi:type IV fimbrial biogenesis protein FimT
MPRATGFTVIELMFVLALVAVLLGIGAPALTTMVVNNRISTAAGDLVADLSFARATAISRTAPTAVCASSDQATCSGGSWQNGWIVFVDANDNANWDAGETIVRVHDPLAGALSVTPSPAGLDIVFRPSGRASAARDFTICKTGYTGRTVRINATGRAVSINATCA